MCGVGLTGGVGAVELVAESRSRAGRLGRAHRGLRLSTLGWVTVAVNRVALIWEFARMDILTIRVSGGLGVSGFLCSRRGV